MARFIFCWITGSPTVTVDLQNEFVAAKCPECLFAFIIGWIKYSLENDYSSDKVECNLAGIEMAMKLYQENRKHIGKIN